MMKEILLTCFAADSTSLFPAVPRDTLMNHEQSSLDRDTREEVCLKGDLRGCTGSRVIERLAIAIVLVAYAPYL